MLCAPGSLVEVFWFNCHHYQVGTSRVLDFDLVAQGAVATCKLGVKDGTQAGWLAVSSDGGASYADVPAASPGAGVELGPLTDGQRVAIKVRLQIPGDIPVISRQLVPVFGLGT
jgi:hypothetical protein